MAPGSSTVAARAGATAPTSSMPVSSVHATSARYAVVSARDVSIRSRCRTLRRSEQPSLGTAAKAALGV